MKDWSPFISSFDCFNINFDEFEDITDKISISRVKLCLLLVYSEEDNENTANARNTATTANIIITGQGCSYLRNDYINK